MILCDTVAVDAGAVKFTSEGFLVAQVKAARTGIQNYTAAELGLKDRRPGETIRVYRPEEEVFAKDSLRSFSMIDATIDHPTEMVDSTNWRDLAVGSTGEAVLRDGDFLMVPLILKDQGAIDTWRNGKRELSVGYACDLVFGEGKTPAGETYDAKQTNIRANHLALCDTARGGHQLRVGDGNHGDRTMNLKTITFDGLQVVDVSPAAEAVIVKLQGQLTDATKAREGADAEVVKLKAEAVAKDAEIVKLKGDLTAAAITPSKLRDAAKAYAVTVAKAKASGIALTDAMGEAEIKRAVVVAKMGDAAKAYTDDHVAIAFDALTQGVEPLDAGGDPLRDVLEDSPRNLGDGGAELRNLARLSQYN